MTLLTLQQAMELYPMGGCCTLHSKRLQNGMIHWLRLVWEAYSKRLGDGRGRLNLGLVRNVYRSRQNSALYP